MANNVAATLSWTCFQKSDVLSTLPGFSNHDVSRNLLLCSSTAVVLLLFSLFNSIDDNVRL